MKRQDILEIILNNPEAVFKNANAEAGKYSEYPTYFQVVGTSYDKSCVRIKDVNPTASYYVRDENGATVKDEEGKPVVDTRSIAERSFLKYGDIKSMPTRLIIKSEKTAKELLADFITYHENRERARAENEAEANRLHDLRDSFANALVCAGILPNDDEVGASWHKVTVAFNEEAMHRMITVLKSALVEVGA
jgi:hypothetical protein